MQDLPDVHRSTGLRNRQSPWSVDGGGAAWGAELLARLTGTPASLTRSQVRTFYGIKQEYDIRKACAQLAYQPNSPFAALRETFAYLQRRQSA